MVGARGFEPPTPCSRTASARIAQIDENISFWNQVLSSATIELSCNLLKQRGIADTKSTTCISAIGSSEDTSLEASPLQARSGRSLLVLGGREKAPGDLAACLPISFLRYQRSGAYKLSRRKPPHRRLVKSNRNDVAECIRVGAMT